MSTGKANFNYVQFRDSLFINQDYPIDIISKKGEIDADFNQILLRSENLSQKVKYASIRQFDLFQKILNIHIFLLNNKELSISLKLEYCNLERYFMKKYLSEIIIKFASK